MRQRRDPRTERRARLVPGAERPRFALAPARALLPTRPRRDPRLLRRAATVIPGIRPRIDWKAARAGAAPASLHAGDAARTTAAPEIRVIADPAFLVLAVPDHSGGALSEHDRQVIGAARQLADAGGGAVVALTAGEIAGLDSAGADRAMAFPAGETGEYDPEGRAAAVLAAIESSRPRHVLLPESAGGGADLARRIAALSGERLFAAAEAFASGRACRRMRGGSAEMAGTPPMLISIAPDVFPAHEGVRHEARSADAPRFAATRRIERIVSLAMEVESLALGDADFILSGGNGVTDWQSFSALGRVLGATPGGSRVVCDEGHLPRDRQVGASGSIVTARCYLAFGIAGAPQHLQGITEVRHVVAVNTDLHAEMIKRADLAIIADAQAVMPALLRHARERRAGVAAPDARPPQGGEGTASPAARSIRPVKAAVLLSVGRHPASGRARRAPLDARALEMALSLPGAEIHAIHAGDPAEPALRDYLGMGLARLAVLSTAPGGDPVPALAAHLARLAPDIILCGNRAEAGEDSGMVPYLLAQALGCAVVPDIAALGLDGGQVTLTQALPRGRRRLIETRLPVVAAASAAPPAPRQSAFARARRGIIEPIAAEAPADAFLAACDIRPWRPRPKRMRLAAGLSAADRLKAMTETRSGEGALMIGPAPEEAARAIWDYLLEKRIIAG